MTISIGLIVFSWIWLFLQIPRDAEQVFLHYNILFGVDKIGLYREVYLVPLMGATVTMVNFLLAWTVYRKDWFFSYTIVAIGLVVNIFIAINSVLVVFLNI